MSGGPLAPLPSARELATALERDLRWLARRAGVAVTGSTPVSPLRGVDRPRTAFRVALADGRCVKLRRLKTAARAAELDALLRQLAPVGLPQPLWRRGETLVTQWIAGTPLAAGDVALERIGEAAQLLADVHGVGSPRTTAPEATRERLIALDGQLATLVDAGRLSADSAGRLAAAARRLLPAEARCGVAHGDFAADNLIVDAAGRLRVVDNEAIARGPLDLDLARVWSRWPMSEDRWRVLLAAYGRCAGRRVDDAELAGWKICTLTLSAWYRVRYRLPGVDEALTRLRGVHGSP